MRRTVPFIAALTVALLAGCTASDPDMPGLTATPSAEPSATTSPTPTPTPTGARDLSDPELGIVFTDFPHDADEQTAAAVEAYMLFEKEFWRALTTNVVAPGPWVGASDEAIAWIQAQVGPNSANGVRLGGTLRTTSALVSADVDRVVLDVCRDVTETTVVHDDGTVDVGLAPGEDPTSGARLFLAPTSGDSWKVDTYELTGPC